MQLHKNIMIDAECIWTSLICFSAAIHLDICLGVFIVGDIALMSTLTKKGLILFIKKHM